MFYSRVWLENMTRYTTSKGQTLMLACVVENEEILALLPLLQTSAGNLQPISNSLSTRFSILLRNDIQQQAALVCLAAGLSQLPVQSIRLEPVDPDDVHIETFQKLLEVHHFEAHRHFRFYNWTHPIRDQSFAEYINQRPGSLRNTIQRKQRKLEREHGYDIRLYTNECTDQALADYDVVYQKSWKASEALGDFTPDLVKRFAQLGCLRLAVLYVQQQPIAGQIWFVVQQKASIYRLVYDQDWQRYSPGSILTHYLMQYVIEADQVSEVDFLNGNEPYKQDWMSVRNERWSVTLIRPTESTSWLQKILRKKQNN